MKELKKYTYLDVLLTSCQHTWYRKKEADIFITIQNGKISALQADAETFEKRLEFFRKRYSIVNKDYLGVYKELAQFKEKHRFVCLTIAVSIALNICNFLYLVLL